MEERFPWLIIDKYFNDNPQYLAAHHLDSYNSFFREGIKRIFKEKNPIRLMKEQDPDTGVFGLKCEMYLGGKNGDKIYYGKPMIYDENREHFMYPNEARLRNMTYGITVQYDLEVDFFIRNTETGEIIQETSLLEKIFLGRFPIMLQSDLCILSGLNRQVRFRMGECKNDNGGYFIIDGKEKCVISQEKFADNMIYLRDKGNELYSHSAEVRSVSEDASKPVRTLSIKIVTPSTTLTNNQIVVIVPNVRKPVPLFILMRALGIESDRDIIDYCLLDREKYANYVDLFAPSIHNAGMVFNQEVALKYIATFTKGKTVAHALEILTDYLLPHIGEMNFQDKAYFIGYMVNQLLRVFTKEMKATDRDNFKFKRIELTGSLLYDLFKEYYSLQQQHIFQKFDKEYYYKKGIYLRNFKSLVELNYKEFFGERIVADGFRKAFKGNWGSDTHTKRVGVVQDVNRLSFNSFIAQLRKLNLPLDSSAKITGPRLAHTTQWGIIDTIDTPDGGNVGLHKNLTIMAAVTKGYSAYPMIRWLRMHADMLFLNEVTPIIVSNLCKVLVNGKWVGVIAEPAQIEQTLKSLRLLAVIPIYTSIYWNIGQNTLFIYTDAGRICRPVFYMHKHSTKPTPSYVNDAIIEKINKNDFTWEQLITGFAVKKDPAFSLKADRIYDTISDLYNVTDIRQLHASQAIMEYLDTSETEGTLIAMDYTIAKEYQKPYTHIEIHPSLMLGIMGNQVIFPEHNQLPRDLFACGQARQAISLYHSNFPVRVDKTGIVLNNGQVPLVKSRYLKHINNEEHPCGENTIVAIMSWNGYNVEDSILFNEGSLKRGLFRTTYYNMYESKEESSTVGKKTMDSHFSNIESKNVVGLKPGCDYSQLDDYGLVKENTYVSEKTVLIGKVTNNLEKPDTFLDDSSFPKKGQSGYVDKSFMTEGEEGFRVAKVRIRNERVPDIGDKFSSRCGQKGTLGLVIPEADMPFTGDGIKPDIIINPHAIPSRMTIGQLVETVMGKVCTIQGAFGDCTAFVNKGDMAKTFGQLLTLNGYHSSGTDILYNGQTGEQIQTEIFMGPTYYMRLKHMTKDKINYRAQGPRTALTRQPVQGRANDGGLRIGEMERDGLIGHGITNFLQESMLVRGDDYYMAICNKSGTIAIYNDAQNLFISPSVDGPIKFSGHLSDNLKIQTISKFGRSFSIIRVPYALKLLMHELTTMNVQLRIITDSNIDQMTNMSFSNNNKILTGNDIFKEPVQLPNRDKPSQLEQREKPNYAPLVFNKIPPPPFKKWKIPSIDPLKLEDFMPVPTADYKEYTDLGPMKENSWYELKDTVNAAKSKLDEIPEPQFYPITNKLDMYADLRRLMGMYGMEHVTNAALKMYEMIEQLSLLATGPINKYHPEEGGKCKKTQLVFCNAEMPGAFIIAINHFFKTKCQTTFFDWIASSYLPEAALEAGDDTILDDKYKIRENNREHWLMGPPPNAMPEGEPSITGDITDPEVIRALGSAVKQRFRFLVPDKSRYINNPGATLYTSDVGIKIENKDLNRQEELTSSLNFGQIVTGLLSLTSGGSFITKQFTFFTPFSRSLIALVASFFKETNIVKPQTSRPTNSEVYLVARGFKGISPDIAEKLIELAEAYKTLGKLPTTWGSILKPKILNISIESREDSQTMDDYILEAAQEVHGEQQVAFLNEVYEAYRVLAEQPRFNVKLLGDKYENDAKILWIEANKPDYIKKQYLLGTGISEYRSQFPEEIESPVLEPMPPPGYYSYKEPGNAATAPATAPATANAPVPAPANAAKTSKIVIDTESILMPSEPELSEETEEDDSKEKPNEKKIIQFEPGQGQASPWGTPSSEKVYSELLKPK